jgi:15-cis-phytoene desaturase
VPSVIIVGGGVGGLTVAHELVERGFTVDIYEARDAWGGKSRSQPVPGSAVGARRELPGEHGFRFYPRF